MKFNIATFLLCIDIHEYSAHNMIIESKGVPKKREPSCSFFFSSRSSIAVKESHHE